MDGLIDFYGSMTDPLVFDRFKEADEEICFTRIYRTVDGQENQTVSSTTKCKEEVTMSIQEAVPGKKMLSCLVTICNQEDQAHRTLSMKEKTYNYFLQTMGLSKYVKFGCSNALSFDLVPQYQKGGQVSGFYASVFAKNFFGLFYIYNAEKNLSTGIFWSTEVIHPVFLKAVSSLQSLAYHRGFLLLAMAASINAFNQRHIETVRLQNAKIEARTGCNGWRNVERDTTDTSLSELSTQMSGFASSLITHRRSVKLCTEILTKVESIDVSNSIHGIAETAETRDIFESHISVIKRRAVVQSMLVELLLGRVQNQISALFNLMNREETERSISVALDSRTIALASKHDSSSMKTLAAVTVGFLPGTFVASLFSMSMFDWQADSKNVLTPRFWIYWAVTIPLTLATVCAWYVWINRRAAIERSRDQQVVQSMESLVNAQGDFKNEIQ